MRTPNAKIGIAAILTIAVLSAVVVCFLPTSPYQRFQLMDGTIYGMVRRSYERVHFDPRPIDVAVFGPSTTLLGVNADRVTSDLVAAGKPAVVENLSVVAAGRNLQWALADELIRTKRPKVIVLGIIESPNPWGHPAFKYIAPASAVLIPPAPLLHNYFYDLSYLPFRQLELFSAWLLPEAIGLAKTFDPEKYATERKDFTVTWRDVNGTLFNMDRVIPLDELMMKDRNTKALSKKPLAPGGVKRYLNADDRVYVSMIAREAAAHGVRLMFLYMPHIGGKLPPTERAYYERFGEIVDNGDLSTNSQIYESYNHFNHVGSLLVSDRLSAALARHL